MKSVFDGLLYLSSNQLVSTLVQVLLYVILVSNHENFVLTFSLVATDEELGGAPSEGVDVASSSFPSVTNRGLLNQ